MSEEPIDPIAPELAELLGAERRAGKAPAPGRAAVRARLDATLFHLPPGGGAGGADGGSGAGGAGGAGAGNGKVLAALLAGAVVGGALVYAVAPPKTVTVERIVHVPASPPSAPPEPAPPPVAPIDAASVAASATAAVVPAGGPRDAGLGESLAAERALLEPARAALGRHDAASALAAASRHETRFPGGKLAEEREAIAVQALALLGRREEARTRASRFRARYPGSVLQSAVDAAIGDDR